MNSTEENPNPRTETELFATPVGFARGLLDMDLYPWAEKVLWDLDNAPVAIALRAANGSGKTSRIGTAAALWHASVFPDSICIVTSGVYRQVKEQLFPSMRRYADRLDGWQFNEADVTAANGSRIIGFSTDEAGKAEGWHNENLLAIIDEAKSVPDFIFQSVERCQPNRVLLMSSPGACTGAFYEAFSDRRKFYKQHVATAFDCPHIPEKWIKGQIAKYGEDHPLVRSMIYADFMKHGEDGTVIPLAFVESCIANPPAFKDGLVTAFCDFAAGGDENVLAVCRGNRVEIVAAWREKDTMRAVGQFIRHFHDQELNERQIYGDEGGLGKTMCDALKESGWNIRRVNNGSPAYNHNGYANRSAEIWFEGRTLIERKQIILPNDKTLTGQLTTRRGWPNSKGKLELETKPEMLSRGVHSPDRADAVLGAIICEKIEPKIMMTRLRGL